MALNTTLQVGSKWIWKDETQTLESVNPLNTDKQTRGRDRRGKGGHLHDPSKRSERGHPSASRVMPGRSGALPKSPKQGRRQSVIESYVRLNDVKDLALDMLADVDDIPKSFEALYPTSQFDDFIKWLLNYFQSFNEKQAHDSKPNPMNIEPSLAEKQYYEGLRAKIDLAQKQLGRSYGVLVLGIGLDHQHHMACGMSRVSSTYKDRSMYETLYAFCTFLVWITFRRQDFELIQKELGRILRSDTFNPAIRIRNAPDAELPQISSNEVDQEPEKKLTPAEYRRIQGKRPAIKSIINQRSPALVSILPEPHEAVHCLFDRTPQSSSTSLSALCKDSQMVMESAAAGMQKINLERFKVGIIGENRSQFNMRTLTPIGAENEDGEQVDEAKEDVTRRESQIGMSTATKKSGQTRQATAVSQVTTEALSDQD